ncbi:MULTISPECIES: hypothetical protein [Sphingomonas]|uniref:hypothetical protein n=1 Tax=Sphingomonas TaxID=13687 RepID=UPI000DEEE3F2|nr:MULTISPECIES: hypothetical protein [Sphingomonas]
MDQFGYVVGLLSIITGLALSDLGFSLHRLLRRRHEVRWDPLVLATAAYFAFTVVRYWYQVWSIREMAGVTSLFFFLGLLIENFLLFLIVASALPDADDLKPGAIDLRAFQRENSRYLWTLFLLYSVMWGAHGFYFGFTLNGYVSPRLAEVFIAPVVLSAGLALSRRRWLQVALFAVLVIHEASWIVISGY